MSSCRRVSCSSCALQQFARDSFAAKFRGGSVGVSPRQSRVAERAARRRQLEHFRSYRCLSIVAHRYQFQFQLFRYRPPNVNWLSISNPPPLPFPSSTPPLSTHRSLISGFLGPSSPFRKCMHRHKCGEPSCLSLEYFRAYQSLFCISAEPKPQHLFRFQLPDAGFLHSACPI